MTTCKFGWGKFSFSVGHPLNIIFHFCVSVRAWFEVILFPGKPSPVTGNWVRLV